MKKKNIPIVSIITLNLLIIGVLFTSRFEMAFIWLTWAICAAALFLFECLFGLIKKTFAPNISLFIPIAVMGAAIIIAFANSDPHAFFGTLGAQVSFVAFAPPMFVALCANVGNIIYKAVKKRKAALTENVGAEYEKK